MRHTLKLEYIRGYAEGIKACTWSWKGNVNYLQAQQKRTTGQHLCSRDRYTEESQPLCITAEETRFNLKIKQSLDPVAVPVLCAVRGLAAKHLQSFGQSIISGTEITASCVISV